MLAYFGHCFGESMGLFLIELQVWDFQNGGRHLMQAEKDI
jgi:hypothetical protein